MQQLDAITLKHLASELDSWLSGAKVSKVQHPSAHEFLLTFWGGPVRVEDQNLLYINLHPEQPFCALIESSQKSDWAMSQFAKPTALCMLLRKHLQGASVSSVQTLDSERVLNIVLENFNELGNRVRLLLSLELMGKHSNMILVDEISGSILGVAHGVSERMSSHRELSIGLPYAAPPHPMGKKVWSQLSQADFLALWQNKPAGEDPATYLSCHIAGVGRQIAEDLCAISIEAKALFRNLEQLSSGDLLAPLLYNVQDGFSIVPPANEENSIQELESVNALVKAYFGRHLQQRRLGALQKNLLQALARQAKKLAQRLQEVQPVSDAEIGDLQETGDRILAAVSAHEVAANQPQKGLVQLTRYDTGEPWPIEVDPSCSWVENAQLYYRRAKKAKARKEAYLQVLEQLEDQKSYLDELRHFVEQAEHWQELSLIEQDMKTAGFLKPDPVPEKGKKVGRKAEDDRWKGVMVFTSSDGLEILVGKSGQANENLVGKLARPDDIWLHVHQMPGSHVLIRSVGDHIPNQTLLEAANLAAYYSVARDSLNVPVIYTQSRYVRKIPRSYPGHVNYREEQTVFITPDLQLIQQIKPV